jgi:hypothetical protein
MNTEIVENNVLIATRVPPGDQWSLVGDSKRVVHGCLTDALQAYFEGTGFKGSYRLDPLDSKLYAIQSNEVEVPEEKPKTYSFYGEFTQGV